jgi:hypothetical protein
MGDIFIPGGGGLAPDNQLIPHMLTAQNVGTIYGLSASYRGAVLYCPRPTTFNRLIIRQTSTSAGIGVDLGIYQAADGIAVDPWPKIASFEFTSVGSVQLLKLTPSEGTITMAAGNYLLIAKADVTATVNLGAYNTSGTDLQTRNVPVGEYPTMFDTAENSVPPPATIAWSALVPNVGDLTVAHRMITE